MSIAHDHKVWLGGHDFSGVMNALGLELTLEAHDATTFDDGTRRSVTGLRAVRAEHQGYFDAETVDARLFDAVDLDGEVMTVAVAGAGEGTLAYSFPTAIAQYSPGATVGEQLAFILGLGRGVGRRCRRAARDHPAQCRSHSVWHQARAQPRRRAGRPQSLCGVACA